MNMKNKIELIRQFFQVQFDAINQEHSSALENKRKEFNLLLNKIANEIRPEDIHSFLHHYYNDLCKLDSSSIHVLSTTDDIDAYDNSYVFIEKTSSLYFVRSGQIEKVNIIDMERFKNDLSQTIGTSKNKSLSTNEIEGLITSNGGHIPIRLSNPLETKLFLSGSQDLLRAIHDKDTKRSKYKAFGLTLLSCCAFVTIPFAGMIYNRLKHYFYQRQAIQEQLSDRDDLVLKINNKIENCSKLDSSTKYSLIHLQIEPKEIFSEDNRREIANYKYCNVKFSNNDLFNAYNELRKIDSRSSFFRYDPAVGRSENCIFATKEQTQRSARRKQTRENLAKIMRL